jgi:hypothetical protein
MLRGARLVIFLLEVGLLLDSNVATAMDPEELPANAILEARWPTFCLAD